MTIERVVIAHGYTADPGKHWFPWLASEIEMQGGEAHVIAFPDPEHPERRAWTDAALAAIGTPDPGTWLVGHSLGCITLLRALAEIEEPWELGGLVLVAGFGERLETLPALDGYLAEALSGEEIARIARNTGVIRTICSDDDMTVPPEHTVALAERLGSEVAVVPGAGHFVDREGWVELPAVLVALHAK